MAQKDSEFPAYRWHPETGECRLCNSAADVLDGWIKHHPARVEDARPAPVPKAPPLPMSRDEVVAALTAGGIEFKKNLGYKALYDLLVTSLQDHLEASGIEVPTDATAPQLLALVPKPE